MQIHYKLCAFVILYNLLLFNSGYFVVFIVHIQQMLYTFMQPISSQLLLLHIIQLIIKLIYK